MVSENVSTMAVWDIPVLPMAIVAAMENVV
jgi:hypothetical protein